MDQILAIWKTRGGGNDALMRVRYLLILSGTTSGYISVKKSVQGSGVCETNVVWEMPFGISYLRISPVKRVYKCFANMICSFLAEYIKWGNLSIRSKVQWPTHKLEPDVKGLRHTNQVRQLNSKYSASALGLHSHAWVNLRMLVLCLIWQALLPVWFKVRCIRKSITG